MADESKVDGNVREEVVLSPKVEGDSPTRSKQPLKLRFWPTDGKHLNPAVRGMLFVVVLGFLVRDGLWGDVTGRKEEGCGRRQR